MVLRFYFDHDSANRAVVDGLRRLGIDILTTAEAGQEQHSDLDQLAFAASEQRTLYSANCPDFARLHADWMRTGATHHGIILRATQRLPIGMQVGGLWRISQAHSTGVNLFAYLESWAGLETDSP